MQRLAALAGPATIIAGICTISSCSRPIRPPSSSSIRASGEVASETRMAAAVDLVRAGCLDCLIEALRQYQALQKVPAVAAEATAGAARTAALVAIRERELGLEESGALAQARLLS